MAMPATTEETAMIRYSITHRVWFTILLTFVTEVFLQSMLSKLKMLAPSIKRNRTPKLLFRKNPTMSMNDSPITAPIAIAFACERSSALSDTTHLSPANDIAMAAGRELYV